MFRYFVFDIFIDLAMLMGSVVCIFGYYVVVLFINNMELEQYFKSVSEVIGECLWLLFFWEMYEEDLKLDVVDVCNFSGCLMVGVINVVKFLEFFMEEYFCWVYLDIVGVVFGDLEFIV